MEKVLCGCPNLECLELDNFKGVSRLEINCLNLRKLIMKNCATDDGNTQQLEILAPYIQELELWDLSYARPLQLSNMASLVTAFVNFIDNQCYSWYDNDHVDQQSRNVKELLDRVDKECRYLKELLHSLVHVNSLELGLCCIECLSILARKGLQVPTSSRRTLTLKAALLRQNFPPAICSLLQSLPDLETFVIDWSWKTARDENEDGKQFENHIFDCSLLHLRTIKIINLHGPLSSNKFILQLVKYLLKNAESVREDGHC